MKRRKGRNSKRQSMFALKVILTAAIAFFTWNTAAVMAMPGILQTATRDGFFSNQFPDTLISLTHYYYYWGDEFADDDGHDVDIDDFNISLGLERLIRPWHFGDRNQYQFILEGILSVRSIDFDDNPLTLAVDDNYRCSGINNPMVYMSLGWNNPNKTTHLQAALITVFPWGDQDALLPGENSYQVMPIFAGEQQWGDFWVDFSMGYYHFFDDLDTNAVGQDYFEINVCPSYHIGTWNLYLQGDYKATDDGEDINGVDQDNDGYNLALAAGVAWMFRPNMQANLKYVQDIDGENEFQGQGFNFRLMWIF